MTNENERTSNQSTETGTDGTNDDGDDSSEGIRRRSVIAATLGSPALLGLGFGAADHFALPGPSSAAMSGAASPVERAQAGDPVLAQMDSVASSVGEEPAQNLPVNQYHVLQASPEVFDTLEREPGEQVRVSRDEDMAVFTLAEEVEPDDDDTDDTDDEEELAAAVEFSEQTTDGSTVTVDSARLDDGGFVVIHDSTLLDGEVIPSVIGSSEYLESGEAEDLEVELDEPLEEDDTLIAMPHQDTNDNETYDFTDSEGEDDGPYVDEAGDPIIDDAEVTVGEEGDTEDGEAEVAAEVEFSDQTTDGSTVTVDSARLDDGGFVVIHDSTLLDGEVIPSVIGASEYLEAGESEDLEVELDEPLEEDDTLIAMPHQDTNDNEIYDFVEFEGQEDGPYTDEAGEAIVDDAQVTVGEEGETEDNGTGTENETEDDDTGVGNETEDDDAGVGNETEDDGAENETNGETETVAQQADGIVRASTEGKCRLAFYEETEFEDDRRWGPLRGDETCDLADEEFEVEIDPRVPTEDLDADQAEEDGDLVETFVEGETDIAVIAPHGGRIQPYTDQQAELMIEEFEDITAWMLQGYGQDTSFYRWYVPSAEISEASFPGLAELSEETYDLAVSFNGVNDENIYVGGTAEESLRQDIADAIEEALPHDGSPVVLGENQYAADSSETLVNRISEDNGVWIGQPIADRRNNWDVIVEAVGSVLEEE